LGSWVNFVPFYYCGDDYVDEKSPKKKNSCVKWNEKMEKENFGGRETELEKNWTSLCEEISK
jgi:hypothetical protein